ncbi:hypothetical protein SLA2020_347930 [Shorea laevis]
MRSTTQQQLNGTFFLVLFLAVSRSSQETVNVGFPPRKWHVHVVNGLSRSQLFLHCKSKDNDLDMHHLEVGDDFSWSFRENVFETTLYWCYMRKDDKTHATLDVFGSRNRISGFLIDATGIIVFGLQKMMEFT